MIATLRSGTSYTGIAQPATVGKSNACLCLAYVKIRLLRSPLDGLDGRAHNVPLARSVDIADLPTDGIVEGVQPFFACQSVVRDQTRHEYTRHMICLRHEAQIGTKEAKEVVVVNAHDRYSAYNMMVGVLSPMAQHGEFRRGMHCGQRSLKSSAS